jgi:6-pyruvoyl-tetrahydropterin synthase
MWRSHVEAVASAKHSNGPEGQKCYNDHGHDWKVEVDIEYRQVDGYGWGPPFGAIKAIIREYDHSLSLNQMLYPDPPSAENFAKRLYDRIVSEVIGVIRIKDMWLQVTVHEGEGNRVTYFKERP